MCEDIEGSEEVVLRGYGVRVCGVEGRGSELGGNEFGPVCSFCQYNTRLVRISLYLGSFQPWLQLQRFRGADVQGVGGNRMSI